MAKLIRALAIGYLVAVIFFGWGWLAADLKIPPHRLIEPVYSQIHAFFAESHKESVRDMIAMDHQEQAIQFDGRGLVRREPGFREDGFLLLSRYSKEAGQTVVELMSLQSGETLHRWRPALDKIFAATPGFDTGANTAIAYRAQHPYLMENGDLLITSGEGPLVRIDSCGDPVWVIERHFHHSIERREDGNFVVPLVIRDGPNELGIPMREDGFGIVSPSGELLETVSIHDLLLKNGYQGLIYGVGEFEEDRYHLNDVQPVPGRPGEYLVSIRNISSVARIDAGSGRVLWLKTGPWVNQHDVNPLDGGWISVFGNDLVRSTGKLLNRGYSQIYLYHPVSGRVRTPYSEVLREAGMHTKFEGRVRILPNGDAFIEETNRDRLLRVSPRRVRWEYVNAITDATSGALHWSRYLEKDRVTEQLADNLKCDKSS